MQTGTGQQRPFRFAVTSSRAGSRQEWVDRARRLEDLGYAALTVADHFPERLAIVPAMMCALDATERLHVASWVFCNDFRHPAMLYKEAATLDLLSEGRFELGIGAGWLKSEYDSAGIPFDPPGVRVSRMEEAVQVLKGLATDDVFDFEGEYYRIENMEAAPQPVQQPLPPLYIGGGGKRLLSFAAREADIVGMIPKALPGGGLEADDITEAAIERKLGWIREAAGDRDPELDVLIYTFEVADDRMAAAERHAAQMPGVTAEALLASPHALIGTVDQMAEDLRERRERFGISHIVLNTNVPEHYEQMAPVVAKLT